MERWLMFAETHDDVLVIHCMQSTTGQTETIMIILVCFVILD